jgi:hypothetical protein
MAEIYKNKGMGKGKSTIKGTAECIKNMARQEARKTQRHARNFKN